MAFLRTNFAIGYLASAITATSPQITVKAGHTLPLTVGQFRLVIWDSITYPNPADDVSAEIVTASYSGSLNIYDITRAQEGTLAIVHGENVCVALHYTAGVSEDDLTWLGSYQVDESGIVGNKILNYNNVTGKLEYTDAPTLSSIRLISGGTIGVSSGNLRIDSNGTVRIYPEASASVALEVICGGVIIYQEDTVGKPYWKVGTSGMMEFSTPGGYPGMVIWTGNEEYANEFDLYNRGTHFRLSYEEDGATGLNIIKGGHIGIGAAAANRAAQYASDTIVTIESVVANRYSTLELVGTNRPTGEHETIGMIAFLYKDGANYNWPAFIEAAEHDGHNAASINFYTKAQADAGMLLKFQIRGDGRIAIGTDPGSQTVRALIDVDETNLSATALKGTPNLFGSILRMNGMTFTDNNTVASGTAANWIGHGFLAPTLASTNTNVTTTNAATVYIAGAPIAGTNETITNRYALWIDSGRCRIDDDLVVGSLSGVLKATAGLLAGSATMDDIADGVTYGRPTLTQIGNWDTAYGWGDHAGLYDAAGTAAGLVGTHEGTYNHVNYNTAYNHSQIVAGNPHSVTKAEVGLGGVENTTLSTWAGSTNLTTLGVATAVGPFSVNVVSGNPYLQLTVAGDNRAYISYYSAGNSFDILCSHAGCKMNFYYGAEAGPGMTMDSSGYLYFYRMRSGATQAAAGASANELWKTNGHDTLPNNVIMIGV